MTGRVVAYVRCSTAAQKLGLAAQRLAVLAAYPGATVVEEVASAGGMRGWPELMGVVAGMGRGDVLVAAKVDRLVRNVGDLCALAARADREGWTLHLLDLGSTGTPMGRAMFQMAGVLISTPGASGAGS